MFGKDVDAIRALARKHYDRDYVHEITEAIYRVNFLPKNIACLSWLNSTNQKNNRVPQ